MQKTVCSKILQPAAAYAARVMQWACWFALPDRPESKLTVSLQVPHIFRAFLA